MSKTAQPSRETLNRWRQRLKAFYFRVRSLQGDPHYVAMGMAVGVFVAFTPTIPFHTVLTIALAFFLRGSKPAALIGSWLANPLTFPALYYGSYKLGVLMLGRDMHMHIRYGSIKELMTLGWDVGVAMIAGGVLLGILPAVGAYFLTYHLFLRVRSHRSTGHTVPGNPIDSRVHPQNHSGNSKGRTENQDN